MSQRSATSHAPCVYSLEYSGAAPVTISPQPSPSAVRARTMMTSRTVSVPNDVVNGETSGNLQDAELETLEGHGCRRAGDGHALRLRRGPFAVGARARQFPASAARV